MGPIEILEDLSFRIILKHQCSKRKFQLAILLILTQSLKIRTQEIEGTLVLKWWVETPGPHQYLGFRKISSRARLLSFFFLFSMTKRIAFKCSLGLHFYALSIGFFRSAQVRFSRFPYPAIYSDAHPGCYLGLWFMVYVIQDCGFDQWSVVSFVIKKHFVYLCLAKKYIKFRNNKCFEFKSK